MKRTIIAFICMMSCGMTLSAQSPIKHKVKKGETLSGIAAKYHVEEWRLLLENPTASSSFRKGMILYIPTETGEVLDEGDKGFYADENYYESSAYTTEYPSHSKSSKISSSAVRMSSSDRESDYSSVFYLGLAHQRMGNQSDVYNFNIGMNYDLGGRCYIMDYGFAEALVGYSWSSVTPKAKYNKYAYSVTNHMLNIPLHVGVQLPFGDEKSVNLFLGPRFSYLFYSKQELDGEKIKWKDIKKQDGFKAWSTSLEFGLDLNISSGGLRVSYGIPFVDKKAKAKQGIISIGFVF